MLCPELRWLGIGIRAFEIKIRLLTRGIWKYVCIEDNSQEYLPHLKQLYGFDNNTCPDETQSLKLAPFHCCALF